MTGLVPPELPERGRSAGLFRWLNQIRRLVLSLRQLQSFGTETTSTGVGAFRHASGGGTGTSASIDFQGQWVDGPYVEGAIVIRARGYVTAADTSEIDQAKAGTYYATDDVLPGDLPPGDSGGTGASLGVSIGGGVITSIHVITGGSNYTGSPTVQISGDGSGATAHLTIVSGVITAVTVDTGGSGYTGATATAINPAQKWTDFALFRTHKWVLLRGQQRIILNVGRDSTDDLHIRVDKDKDDETAGSIQLDVKAILDISGAGDLVMKPRETVATDEACVEHHCIVLRSDFY